MGSGVNLSYVDKVLDQNQCWGTKEQLKGVLPILSHDNLPTKKVWLKVPLIDPWDSANSLSHSKSIELLIETLVDKAHPDQVIKVEATLPNEKWV